MNKITINAQIGDKSCLHVALKCCKKNYGISATWVGKNTIVFNNTENNKNFKWLVKTWLDEHRTSCQLENVLIEED